MLRSSVMLVLWALGSVALAADPTLAPGTRVRLRTVAPPWNEGGGVRDFGGRVLGEDDDTVTIQLKGEEPATRTKKGRWLVAELVELDDRFLTLRLPRKGTTFKLARELVTRLEASKGGSRGRGALVGAGVGASFCALFAAIAPSSEGIGTPDRGEVAIIAAAEGLIFGAIIGSSALGEKWRPVDGARLRGTVGPSPGGGVRAALTVGF